MDSSLIAVQKRLFQTPPTQALSQGLSSRLKSFLFSSFLIPPHSVPSSNVGSPNQIQVQVPVLPAQVQRPAQAPTQLRPLVPPPAIPKLPAPSVPQIPFPPTILLPQTLPPLPSNIVQQLQTPNVLPNDPSLHSVHVPLGTPAPASKCPECAALRRAAPASRPITCGDKKDTSIGCHHFDKAHGFLDDKGKWKHKCPGPCLGLHGCEKYIALSLFIYNNHLYIFSYFL